MDNLTIGVFGSDPASRSEFAAAVGKKSEAEGIAVYHRTDGGRRFSILDDPTYPEKLQGASRIASISDHACYLFPAGGRLAPPDGELAVLIESFGLPGAVELPPSGASSETVRSSFKGVSLASFPVEGRDPGSTALEVSKVTPREDFAQQGCLIYVDRSFNVKGVGTVALGFVLSGNVKVHDRLRSLPTPGGVTAEVRGIQINDVDQDGAGRGVRVGLALKGVDAKDLERASWFDDGSFPVSDRVTFSFAKSPFYRQELGGRDMHIQLPGLMSTASYSVGAAGEVVAALPYQVPVWEGMRAAAVDLNGKGLRVAGGFRCKI